MTTIDPWTLMHTSITSGTPSTSASSAHSSLLPTPKPFKCPKPNCVKSFTQANGLNHHLAFGSCKFEPPKNEEALHEVGRETPNDLVVQRQGQSRIPRLKRSDGPIPTLRSSQVGTFFQASNNVRIPGAQFTSARDVITINYLQHPEKTLQDFTEDDPTKTSPLEINSVSPSSFKPTSPEIYTRQLAITGRGYPLWIPEPNNQLPVEYQKKGIGIGDVGIITHYGAFDFLFNICVPAEDSINPPEMPEDFTPLSPPLNPRDVRGYAAFKLSSHLASANVKTSQSDKGSIISFRSSASEGAILTMPNGSNAVELRNIPRFKKYASTNAMKWYKYLILVCGDEAENGDLRLVVGFDKATAWGMATFHGSSRENAFLLEFKPIDEKNFGRTYGWDYSGTAEVKSGPDLNEMEKLRILDQADSPVAYENQCLFVQMINITLQADAWDRLVAEPEEIDHGDDETQRGNPKHGSEPQHSSSNPDNPTGGLGSRQQTSGGPSDETSIRPIDSSQSVQFSSSPRAPNIHPSSKINELLLKNNPNATIALTEDKDWMSVIEKDDTELPPPEVLYPRIVAKHQICEEQGTIYIQLKDSGTEDALFQSDVPIQLSRTTPISADHSLKMSQQSVGHLVKPSGGMIDGTPVEKWIVQTQTDNQNATAIQVKQDADTSHLKAKPTDEPMAPGDDLTQVLLGPSTTFEGNTIEEKEGEAKKQEVRQGMFGSGPMLITGGAFTQINQSQSDSGFVALSQKISHGAMYDSAERYSAGRCHPGTREKIINAIIEWANDSSPKTNVLWLWSPPSGGKSSIMQTVSEVLYESYRTRYAASFFFGKGVAGRGESGSLFSTLAHQVACNVEGMREALNEAMTLDPLLPSKNMATQFLTLIVQPLLNLPYDIIHTPTIIIDGLDECQGSDDQRAILTLIRDSLTASRPVPLRFIIASRPEHAIRDEFNRPALAALTERIELDDSRQTSEDIRKYLEDGFDEIYENNRDVMGDVAKPWPLADQVNMFVRNASGQFGYASTVLRFIGSYSDYSDPQTQLEVISKPGPLQAHGFSPLDHLYITILSTYPRRKELMVVLGGLFIKARLSTIVQYLDVSAGELKMVLRAISSVIKYPRSQDHVSIDEELELIFGPIEQEPPEFAHFSFRDFLEDKGRSGEFWVDPTAVYSNIHNRFMDTIIALLKKTDSYTSQTAFRPRFVLPQAIDEHIQPRGYSFSTIFRHIPSSIVTKRLDDLLDALRAFPLVCNKMTTSHFEDLLPPMYALRIVIASLDHEHPENDDNFPDTTQIDIGSQIRKVIDVCLQHTVSVELFIQVPNATIFILWESYSYINLETFCQFLEVTEVQATQFLKDNRHLIQANTEFLIVSSIRHQFRCARPVAEFLLDEKRSGSLHRLFREAAAKTWRALVVRLVNGSETSLSEDMHWFISNFLKKYELIRLRNQADLEVMLTLYTKLCELDWSALDVLEGGYSLYDTAFKVLCFLHQTLKNQKAATLMTPQLHYAVSTAMETMCEAVILRPTSTSYFSEIPFLSEDTVTTPIPPYNIAPADVNAKSYERVLIENLDDIREMLGLADNAKYELRIDPVPVCTSILEFILRVWVTKLFQHSNDIGSNLGLSCRFLFDQASLSEKILKALWTLRDLDSRWGLYPNLPIDIVLGAREFLVRHRCDLGPERDLVTWFDESKERCIADEEMYPDSNEESDVEMEYIDDDGGDLMDFDDDDDHPYEIDKNNEQDRLQDEPEEDFQVWAVLQGIELPSLMSLEDLAALSGVPGLAAGVKVLSAVLQGIEQVKLYKQQCRDMSRRCIDFMVALRDSFAGLEGTKAVEISDEIELIVLRMNRKVKEWGSWNPLKSFVQKGEIKDGIDKIHREIDAAMMKFSIQMNMEMTRGQIESRAIQERDKAELREVLQGIVKSTDDMKALLNMQGSNDSRPVEEMMESLQTELMDPYLQPKAEEAFKAGLWMLHENTSKLPPLTDLSGQVTLTSQNTVAKGSLNDIYQGQWLDREPVALRLPRSLANNSEGQDRFQREVSIWRELTHPNVVPLYGVVYMDDDLYSVSPWMDNGSAVAYLKKFPSVDRIKILVDVACGLEYLHRRNIVHGDLRGENVLISKNGVACLSDFGMSEFLEEASISTQSINTRWSAPELLHNVPASTHSDIWSFGMVFLELISGDVPYSNLSRDIAVLRELDNSNIPQRPTKQGLTDEMWELMLKCWQKIPESRPSISTLKALLMGMNGPAPVIVSKPTLSSRFSRFTATLSDTKSINGNPDTRPSTGRIDSRPSSGQSERRPSTAPTTATSSASSLFTPKQSLYVPPQAVQETDELSPLVGSSDRNFFNKPESIYSTYPRKNSTSSSSSSPPIINYEPPSTLPSVRNAPTAPRSTSRLVIDESVYSAHPRKNSTSSSSSGSTPPIVNYVPPSTLPSVRNAPHTPRSGLRLLDVGSPRQEAPPTSSFSLPAQSGTYFPPAERTMSREFSSAGRSVLSTNSRVHITAPVREAVSDPRIIVNVDYTNGVVTSGTLEGLVDRLINNFNLRTDVEYRDVLLTACADFTTPEDLFAILSRRFYDAEMSDDDHPEDRVALQYNIFMVMTYWISDQHLHIDHQLMWQMKTFCESAIRTKSSATMVNKATDLLNLVSRRAQVERSPSILLSPDRKLLQASQVKPADLAIGLTLLEGDKYKILVPSDYIGYVRKHPGYNNIEAACTTNNKIILWVKDSILHYDSVQDRATVLKFFIHTAMECRKLRNFSSMVAIATAVHSAPIERLRLTKAELSPQMQTRLNSLEGILKPAGNHSSYRDALKDAANAEERVRCVPWLAVHLKELHSVLQRYPTTVNEHGRPLINFQRYLKFMEQFKDVRQYIPPDLERYRQQGQLDYLEHQLRNLRASANIEEELMQRSIRCEV